MKSPPMIAALLMFGGTFLYGCAAEQPLHSRADRLPPVSTGMVSTDAVQQPIYAPRLGAADSLGWMLHYSERARIENRDASNTLAAAQVDATAQVEE